MDGLKYEQAVQKKEKLEHFISLVDEYECNSDDQWIIKKYALTNSIVGVIKIAYKENKDNITRDYVLELLKQKPQDELHKIIIENYKRKIKRKK